MATLPDFFFAMYNRPKGYDIVVKNGSISAVGDEWNPDAERLKMDLINGKWVNEISIPVDNLVFPPAELAREMGAQ